MNVRRTLEGLHSLVEVTGTGLLARCFFPGDWEFAAPITKEECRHGIFKTVLRGKDVLWVGNTSRDQYSGAFFGLAVAYDRVTLSGEEVSGRLWEGASPGVPRWSEAAFVAVESRPQTIL